MKNESVKFFSVRVKWVFLFRDSESVNSLRIYSEAISAAVGRFSSPRRLCSSSSSSISCLLLPPSCPSHSPHRASKPSRHDDDGRWPRELDLKVKLEEILSRKIRRRRRRRRPLKMSTRSNNNHKTCLNCCCCCRCRCCHFPLFPSMRRYWQRQTKKVRRWMRQKSHRCFFLKLAARDQITPRIYVRTNLFASTYLRLEWKRCSNVLYNQKRCEEETRYFINSLWRSIARSSWWGLINEGEEEARKAKSAVSNSSRRSKLSWESRRQHNGPSRNDRGSTIDIHTQ